MGFRQGRQDGRGTRLHSDAGAGGQADREDLVGRYQELSFRVEVSRPPKRAPSPFGRGLGWGVAIYRWAVTPHPNCFAIRPLPMGEVNTQHLWFKIREPDSS